MRDSNGKPTANGAKAEYCEDLKCIARPERWLKKGKGSRQKKNLAKTDEIFIGESETSSD